MGRLTLVIVGLVLGLVLFSAVTSAVTEDQCKANGGYWLEGYCVYPDCPPPMCGPGGGGSAMVVKD